MEFEKGLLDQRIADGKPLVLTFHANMDVKGKAPSEQWFEAFVPILNYLKERETAGKVKVMSLAGLTNLYFPGT